MLTLGLRRMEAHPRAFHAHPGAMEYAGSSWSLSYSPWEPGGYTLLEILGSHLVFSQYLFKVK
jgi:hypothetical protein